MADDAGGNFLVGGAVPGAFQRGLAVAGAIQQQSYFLQGLAGQVAGAVDRHAQRHGLIELVLDEVVEALQVVGGLLVHAVILATLLELVGALVDHRHVFAAE